MHTCSSAGLQDSIENDVVLMAIFQQNGTLSNICTSIHVHGINNGYKPLWHKMAAKCTAKVFNKTVQ